MAEEKKEEKKKENQEGDNQQEEEKKDTAESTDKSQDKKPAPDTQNKSDDTTPVKKPKSKLKMIIIIMMTLFVIILVGIMAAQAIIITRLKVSIDKMEEIKKHTKKNTADHAQETSHGEAHAGLPLDLQNIEDTTDHEPSGDNKEKLHNDIYMPIEKMTVNLMPDSGGHHFLQIETTLIIGSEAIKETIKSKMPEIKSNMILFLSAQKFNRLHSEAGKKSLANGMKDVINSIVSPKSYAIQQAMIAMKKNNIDSPALKQMKVSLPIKDVLFSSFFIQ